MAEPARVVSINLCTDQLAMLLAKPGQLVSVSDLAYDRHSSAMAAEAEAFPPNHGQAEEVFLMAPDVVLAGTFTTRAAAAMLRRLGVQVLEFSPAVSLDDVRGSIGQMGAALGQEGKAARMIARFNTDLDASRAKGDERPEAALYYANGYTVGAGALADSILAAAGLKNLAAEIGYAGGGTLPLERLVIATPDLIISGDQYDTPALAQEVLTHPALQALRGRSTTAPVADRNWVCGTPFIMAAIRRLAAARDAVLAER